MSRLGAIFFKNCNLITNGNLFVNRIQTDFSPLISTLRTDATQKLKDLNVPEKPKKPGNPYILFVKDVQQKLAKENPNMGKPEIFQKCGELWKSVNSDTRAKYAQTFKELQEKYDKEFLQYQASLTPAQKDALTEYSEARKKDRQDRRRRKELIVLQKPKRPLNAYTIYLTEISKMRNLPLKMLIPELSEKWKNLTISEREIYEKKAIESKQQYEKDLQEWEEKMKMEGREELVRKRATTEPKEKRQSRILQFKNKDK